MKKNVKILSIFAAGTLLFAACTAKNEQKQTAAAGETVNTEKPAVESSVTETSEVVESSVLKNESQKEPAVNFVDCVLIYDEGSLWYVNAAGELDWYTTISNGSALKAYPATSGSLSDTVESRKLLRSGKKEALEYTKVRFNEKDYWIQSVLLVNNAIPRLITKENAIIYSLADITGATSDMVAVGTIVAFLGEEEDSELGIKFSRITYHTEKRNFKNVYVKSENLSTQSDDVIAKRILAKIASTENAVIKQELLENISLLTLSPELYAQVEEIRAKINR